MSLASHSFVWLVNFETSAKVPGAAEFCFMLPKYCKTFDSYWYLLFCFCFRINIFFILLYFVFYFYISCFYISFILFSLFCYRSLLHVLVILLFFLYHIYFLIVFYFGLRPGQKCHSKVMHRKEVTHSNGSYERKSRGRKLADEMGRGKKKFPWYTHRLMHRKRVTCELHDSYFRWMTINHAIPKIE